MEALPENSEQQQQQHQYQSKIDLMQKYVPFLFELIEKLKEDPQNGSKVIQMQLLYKILKDPEPSISLEELNKVEDALEGIYKKNAASTSTASTSSISEEVTTPKNNDEHEIHEEEGKNEDISKTNDQNETKVDTADEIVDKAINMAETQNEANNEETTSQETEIDSDKEKLANVADENKLQKEALSEAVEKERKTSTDGVESGPNANEEIFKGHNQSSKGDRSPKNDENDKEQEMNISEMQQSTEKEAEKLCIGSEENNKDQESESNAEEKIKNNEEDGATEEEEIEENVELIGMPDGENVDEMILPDSADENEHNKDESDDEQRESEAEESMVNDECEQSAKTSEETEEKNDLTKDKKESDQEKQNTKLEDTIGPKEAATENDCNSEDGATTNNDADESQEANTVPEPELIAMEEDSAETEKNDQDYDPLNADEANSEAKQGTEKIQDQIQNTSYGGCDDDDVEIIESRNSPICLDSDDDELLIAPAPIAVASVAPPPTQRLFARKSTSKPATSKTVPAVQNKPKNFTYLQPLSARTPRRCVVDTIDLLDSSDEETYAGSGQILTTKSPVKRTLLPIQGKNANKSKNASSLSLPASTHIRLPDVRSRVPAPASLPTYKATPQSNFLNAVNLQPASAGENPPAFSAQLCNKNVIIPNAFYGNPPEARKCAPTGAPVSAIQLGRARLPTKPGETTEQQRLDRSYRRWLENFLKQFVSPQQIATHSSFILLQQVLKYKVFARVRDLRTSLNTNAHKATQTVNVELMQELRNTFWVGTKSLSGVGRRFCELACSHKLGKAVTLTTDSRTGRVTSRTRTVEEMALERNLAIEGGITAAVKAPSATSTSTQSFSGIFKVAQTQPPASTIASVRKRQTDDAEYTPTKQQLTLETASMGERKKSLRANRARRFDNNFSYNEDQNDDEFEDEDDNSYAVVQRKVEQKRLEAKQQREKQAKSFENAFIEMFAKNLKEPLHASSATNTSNKRKRLDQNDVQRLSTSIADEEDLLTPTWIENTESALNGRPVTIEDDDSLGTDYEPKEHRIYKVIPVSLRPAPKYKSPTPTPSPSTQRPSLEARPKGMRGRPPKRTRVVAEAEEAEVITCDDIDSGDSKDDIIAVGDIAVNMDPSLAPPNIDRNMHAQCKDTDWCVICNRRVTHIVHHYVNEHRGCEVYSSRLSDAQLQLLRRNQGNMAVMSLYKNGQNQYEAKCLFCGKDSRFMLAYWYQHFAIHTGEYAYRCSGCGIRKPTRSLLTSHVCQPCPKRGSLCQDYTYDAKTKQIEARICTLCNYVQLHRSNIVKHLRTQHKVQQILPKHIQSIALLRFPTTEKTATTTSNMVVYEISEIDDSASGSGAWPATSNPEQDNMLFNYDESSMAQAGQWDDGDPSDDLSFMICGMLDVQMNPE